MTAYGLSSSMNLDGSGSTTSSVLGARSGNQTILVSPADPPLHKVRLYELFAQIETEFDRLHAENRSLKARLDGQEPERKPESSGETYLRKVTGLQTQPGDLSLGCEGGIKPGGFGAQHRAQSADEKAARGAGSGEKDRQGAASPLPVSASKEFAAPRNSKAESALYKQQDNIASKQTDTAASIKLTDANAVAQNANLPRVKKATAQLSHRLKTTYKQHTSRLVSSFRVATSSSSGANPPHAPLPVGAPAFIKELTTHRDGVWEVGSVRLPVRINSHPSQSVASGLATVASSAHVSVSLVGSASADHTVRIFAAVDRGDAAVSPRCIATYTAHAGSVNSVRFASPFGDAPSPSSSSSAFGSVSSPCAYALTASGDCSAHIFRISLGDVLGGSNVLTELDANATQSAVATGLQPAPTPEAGVELKQPIQTFRHTDALICAEWLGAPPALVDSASSTGACWFAGLPEQVATASVDRAAQVWNVETADLVQSLTGHDGELTDVAACGRSRVLVTASRDCTFRVWDLREATTGIKVQQAHRDHVTSCRFFVSHNFWSAPAAAVTPTPFFWYANQLPPHVDATHPALKLVTSSSDRSIKIWDLRRLESPINECRLNAGVNKLAIIATSLSGSAGAGANSGGASSLTASGSSLTASPYCSAYAALALDSGAVRLYDLIANKLLPRAVVLDTVLPVPATQAQSQSQVAAGGVGAAQTAQSQFSGSSSQFAAPTGGVVLAYDANAKHHHSVVRHARMATCCAWMTAQSSSAPNANTELNAYLASSGFDRRVLIWKVKLPTPASAVNAERDAALKENKGLAMNS